MQKKCQRCGNTFTVSKGNYMYCDDCRRLNIPPSWIKKEELTDNRVGQTRADIFKTEIVGAHTEEVDMVNHPPHYKLSNGMESIDVIRAVLTPEEYRGWCKGNALKYQFRAGKKDPTKLVQDYEKTQWFLQELVEVLADEKQD